LAKPLLMSCRDVDETLIDAAFAPPRWVSDSLPRQRVFELLERMVEVAKPHDEGGRILDVLGRLATQSWIEGQLAVVIHGFGAFSEIDLLTYDGLNYTRISQPLAVSVPFDEFVEWVARRGGVVGPLELAFDEPGVELQLVAVEAPADSVQMPGGTGDDSPGSVHRRATARVAVVRVPPEAYRRDGSAPIKANPGDDPDEGWE
jgi:hypothetical protein